jgi:hypothetical protein
MYNSYCILCLSVAAGACTKQAQKTKELKYKLSAVQLFHLLSL